MSSQTGFQVPPGQYPPFAVVTPNDHTAWILIVTALGIACFLFFGSMRALVRFSFGHGFGLDDYILYSATALAVIQSSIVLGACSKGLGKALRLVSPEAQVEVQRMYYASNILFILAIGLSKISVVCFLRRISRTNAKHKIAFNTAIALIAAWTFGSVLAIALQCNLGHPWITVNQKCPGILARWQGISAIDIITEVMIVALVVFLVYTLQTPMSSKVTVVGIFSFRLLIIIIVAFRIHLFNGDGYTTNPFLEEAPFIALTQSQLTYSLMSATIPTFQNFLKSLNTGFGGMGNRGRYGYGYGNSSHTRGQKETGMSFQMSKLRSTNRETSNDQTDEEQETDITRAPHNIYGVNTSGVATVERGDASEAANGETTSIGSAESRRMMIRKEVQWTIRTEQRQ